MPDDDLTGRLAGRVLLKWMSVRPPMFSHT
jgi:hypothetical protein